MPTIAIVGAGPGLGLFIGKVFGRNGFSVALVARDQSKLDVLTARLGELGVDAAGFAADLMPRASLVRAQSASSSAMAPLTCSSTPPRPTTRFPASPPWGRER